MKEENIKSDAVVTTCPKCQWDKEMIVKEGAFFWRGKYFSGLVCETCNSLYDNPNDSFMEYINK